MTHPRLVTRRTTHTLFAAAVLLATGAGVLAPRGGGSVGFMT